MLFSEPLGTHTIPEFTQLTLFRHVHRRLFFTILSFLPQSRTGTRRRPPPSVEVAGDQRSSKRKEVVRAVDGILPGKRVEVEGLAVKKSPPRS